MRKKIKNIASAFLISTTLFSSVVSISCNNIRQVNSKDNYIKKFNKPNTYKDNFILSKVKRIDNDYESLLTAPLIRWKNVGKSKYDYLNKHFYKTSARFLEFYLAKSITLTLNDESKKTFDDDNVSDKVNSNLSSTTKNDQLGAQNGVVQIYSQENNNINSTVFFEALKKATKVEFELKDNIYYSDYQGKKTKYKLEAQDFETSFNLEQNNAHFKDLLDNYSLKDFSFSDNKLTFELNDETKLKDKTKNIELFLTQEITNNLIFNPTPTEHYNLNKNNYGKNYQNICFIGYYILNKNSVDEQIFIKNNNSALDVFNENTKKNILNKITLKYNPIPSDEATFRLQSYNAFKQNLLSESNYDLFNKVQKDEIDNYSNLFGITFTLFKPSSDNTIKYFYNLNPNASNIKELKFNEAFSKLFYNQKLGELLDKNNANRTFYAPHQIVFRNILNNSINQHSFILNFSHNTYWNSFSSQSMIYDSKDKNSLSGDQNVNYLDDINRIYDYDYDESNKEFRNGIIDFKGKNGLINKSISKNKILNINEQLKSSNYDKYKEKMSQILDEFYNKNPEYKNQNIKFTLPIFSDKSTKIESIYERIVKLYNGLDSRLQIDYEYASRDSYAYFSSFQDFFSIDNSFSNYLFNLISLKNNSLLTNFAMFSNEKIDSINYSTYIKK
ncbi:hypothetical protein NPA07_01735 [Mycoplasmopsis caviae]|nr:hypothetical protein [Mycoplasmopsis caviae]UUD35576.1 hypothetical protein NPA07_01735 [Mycoplasmopsis caviae]